MNSRFLFVLVSLTLSTTGLAKGSEDNPSQVEVINTVETTVANTVDVAVTNSELDTRSTVTRTPIRCVTPAFNSTGSQDAICVSPSGTIVPVPAGHFFAVTDIVASSQASNGSSGQAVVRVSSKNAAGVQFGAGTPMILKPGETQSLHFQSPVQVLPAGRTPTASIALNVGDVFPVEVNFMGYLVATEDLGR